MVCKYLILQGFAIAKMPCLDFFDSLVRILDFPGFRLSGISLNIIPHTNIPLIAHQIVIARINRLRHYDT